MTLAFVILMIICTLLGGWVFPVAMIATTVVTVYLRFTVSDWLDRKAAERRRREEERMEREREERINDIMRMMEEHYKQGKIK